MFRTTTYSVDHSPTSFIRYWNTFLAWWYCLTFDFFILLSTSVIFCCRRQHLKWVKWQTSYSIFIYILTEPTIVAVPSVLTSFDPLNPSSLSTYGLFVLSEDYESDFKFRRSLFFILTCFVTYGNFLDTKLILTMLSSSTWLKKVILPIFEILLPFILISEFFKINVIYHYLYLQIMDSICWSFDSTNKVFSHIQIFFHWKNSFVSTYKYIGNILFISICC